VVSIIIPIYNEEKVLTQNADRFEELSRCAEVIFVDGESSDNSAAIASQYSRLVCSKKGLAAQMNCGAHIASSNVLLFLHADTFISTDTLASIKRAVASGCIGGCLTQRIIKDEPAYRLIENFGNIRARLTKVFYGDQGIFVRRDIFLHMGGFAEVPIMEDVLFSKRLRRLGKTTVLAERILVSPRRWEKNGIFKTILFYSTLNILFWLKVPLHRLGTRYDDLR
jgi:rSAM/selenodomain-associated transferase 2